MPWPKGKPRSAETIAKIKAFGAKPNLGNVMSESTKDKLRQTRMGTKASAQTREKQSRARKGKPFTQEHAANISLGRLAWWQAHPEEIERYRLKMTGALSPVWRGGTSSLSQKIRALNEYGRWRTAVFQRDDYTCQMCGTRGGELNADHYPVSFARLLHDYVILSVADAIACTAMWDIGNGRTVCEACHRKTPTFAKNLDRQAV